MTEDEFVSAVFSAAKKRLEDKPWYCGVCLDREDEVRKTYRKHGPEDGFKGACDIIVLDTAYWDGPADELSKL